MLLAAAQAGSVWWPAWVVVFIGGGLVAFLVKELPEVTKHRGGSLSVWVREHVHIRTRKGKVVFGTVMGVWILLMCWFTGHIYNAWPWQ